MAEIALIADDLAPGDARAAAMDWSGLRVERIADPAHPLFAPAYECLWREFGPRGEMESRPVIAARLAWDPRQPVGRHALGYELLAVLRDGALVAVRDHTAIVPLAPPRAGPSGTLVVHLSHVLIAPALRGSGLIGWLRAFPLQRARACAAAAGVPPGTPVTLVAEMEPPDGVTPAVMARLRSYQRAGFAALDPAAVPYRQPDFRPPDEIDRSGVRPVPLNLVVRRVGRERETGIGGGEARALVTALYTMFAATLRRDHMAPLWATLDHYPARQQRIALLPPTRGSNEQ